MSSSTQGVVMITFRPCDNPEGLLMTCYLYSEDRLIDTSKMEISALRLWHQAVHLKEQGWHNSDVQKYLTYVEEALMTRKITSVKLSMDDFKVTQTGPGGNVNTKQRVPLGRTIKIVTSTFLPGRLITKKEKVKTYTFPRIFT